MVRRIATDHADRQPSAYSRERQARDELTNHLLVRAARVTGAERQQIIDDIVVRNLGLAQAIARRYHGRGVDDEELNQVACVGLVAAARRFDVARGGDFVSFAVPTIIGEIKRYFRDHSWSVRPPRRLQELRAAMGAASEEMSQALGRPPTHAELADHLEATVLDVHEASRSGDCYDAVSLDQGPVDGEGLKLIETLGSPERGFDRAEAITMLAEACRTLGPRDRHILELRYFHDWTQQQIADDIGTTQMQVSRLLARILRQLRQQIGPDTPSAA
jgi:RNA polymerase sigma-B factor